MKKIRITFLSLTLFFCYLTAFGQTFTYIDNFDLYEGPYDLRELCLAAYDGKLYVQEDDDSEVYIYENDDPFDYISDFDNENNNGQGILVYDGKLYVANDDEEIKVYNLSDYSLIETIDISDEVERIEGFVFLMGKLFVVDASDDDIEVFEGSTPYDHLETITENLNQPVGITSYGENIFVGDDSDGPIRVYNANDYTYVGSADNGGSYYDGLATICNYILALDNDDEVEVFSAEFPFDYVTSFGSDQFEDIGNECITVDGNRVYVADHDDSDYSVFIFELEEGCAPIPTLSEWGIMAMSIIMLIFGVVAVRQRKVLFG